VCAAGPEGIVVACGKDALRITELQRAGGKRLTAGAFLSGFRLAPGARLGPGHA
jgi:methionyl-tRNA formyltransferase